MGEKQPWKLHQRRAWTKEVPTSAHKEPVHFFHCSVYWGFNLLQTQHKTLLDFFFFFFSQHLFNLCQRWLLLLLSESSGVKYHFRILHHCLGTTAVAVVHHVFSSYGSSFSLMIYLAEVCQGDVFQQNWLLQQD